ncbi:hypothetical protein Tco_1249462 [Tanacetum coccineum]
MDLKNEKNVALELHHHAIPVVPGIAAIPAPHWDDVIPLDVIVISDEEDSSDEENENIPLDVIVISSNDEPEMPAKTVDTQVPVLDRK